MHHNPQEQENISTGSRPRRFWLLIFFILSGLVFTLEWTVGIVMAQDECGILAYEWDGPVTESDRGFPRQQPPINNYDWTKPINYANGTLHYRVEIKRQPEAQDMRLQLCFWQPETANASYKFGLENCGPQQSIKGEPGNVESWTREVQNMWKLDGKLIDWTRPRFRAGVAVKNSSGEPVSDYNGWNWNGEDPKKWYPLDIHFTAVVVPEDGQFCGWNYYLNPTAVTLQTISAGQSVYLIIPLLFILLSVLTYSVWMKKENNQ